MTNPTWRGGAERCLPAAALHQAGPPAAQLQPSLSLQTAHPVADCVLLLGPPMAWGAFLAAIFWEQWPVPVVPPPPPPSPLPPLLLHGSRLLPEDTVGSVHHIPLRHHRGQGFSRRTGSTMTLWGVTWLGLVLPCCAPSLPSLPLSLPPSRLLVIGLAPPTPQLLLLVWLMESRVGSIWTG